MIGEASRILCGEATEAEVRLALRSGGERIRYHSRIAWPSPGPHFGRLGIRAFVAAIGVTVHAPLAGQEADSRPTVQQSRDSRDEVRREDPRRIPDGLRF